MVEALGCGKLAKGFQTVSKLNPRRVQVWHRPFVNVSVFLDSYISFSQKYIVLFTYWFLCLFHYFEVTVDCMGVGGQVVNTRMTCSLVEYSEIFFFTVDFEWKVSL